MIMSKWMKRLAGIFALLIGLSVAMPLQASADDWHHDRDYHHQVWRWERDHDHYRAYPMTPEYAYGARRRYIPPANGEGMLNPRNPNLYWACDSDGHHCHWAPRF
jgi:hypothetical protein